MIFATYQRMRAKWKYWARPHHIHYTEYYDALKEVLCMSTEISRAKQWQEKWKNNQNVIDPCPVSTRGI